MSSCSSYFSHYSHKIPDKSSLKKKEEFALVHRFKDTVPPGGEGKMT